MGAFSPLPGQRVQLQFYILCCLTHPHCRSLLEWCPLALTLWIPGRTPINKRPLCLRYTQPWSTSGTMRRSRVLFKWQPSGVIWICLGETLSRWHEMKHANKWMSKALPRKGTKFRDDYCSHPAAVGIVIALFVCFLPFLLNYVEIRIKLHFFTLSILNTVNACTSVYVYWINVWK